MHTINYASNDDLVMEIVLDEQGLSRRIDNAATLHLIFSDCTRNTMTLAEAYDKFRVKLCERFNCEVNETMAYLIAEDAIKVTSELKKTHVTVRSSKSSESTPPESAKEN